MSSAYVFAVLIISVGALVFMVSKLKFHAVLALYLATIMLALLVGTPMEKIPGMINTGFGNTCKSVAMVIFLGSLLGLILNKTGAIIKLTDSLVKFFGKKRVLWAVGTSCCILGIPVFRIRSACWSSLCALTWPRKPVSPCWPLPLSSRSGLPPVPWCRLPPAL